MLKTLIIYSFLAINLLASESYKGITTGVEIEFSKDKTNWERIKAKGESDLMFGDRKDIQQATKKAIMNAKANISKFLSEEIRSEEAFNEITEILSDTNNQKKSSSRKNVDILINNITVNSQNILKGLLVLEQNINQKEKYLVVTIGMSKKTIEAAENIKKSLDTSITNENNNTNKYIKQYNNGENEILRSKNYDNF